MWHTIPRTITPIYKKVYTVEDEDPLLYLKSLHSKGLIELDELNDNCSVIKKHDKSWVYEHSYSRWYSIGMTWKEYYYGSVLDFYLQNISIGRCNYPINHRKIWRKQEIDFLLECVCEEYTLSDLAELLERRTSAIFAKLSEFVCFNDSIENINDLDDSLPLLNYIE